MAGKLSTVVAEFKAFILRGNVLDLAVAVVIGAAFGLVIDAFTNGVLMAFVAAIFGQPSFDAIEIHLGDGIIEVGALLTAVVNFLIVAAALFFVLKVATRLMARKRAEPAAEATSPTDEVLLLTEIRDLLRRRG